MTYTTETDRLVADRLNGLESLLIDVFGADQIIIRGTKLEILGSYEFISPGRSYFGF